MLKKNKIVIAGAGLTGLSAALCLQNQAESIVILETHLSDVITGKPSDARPISLSLGTQRILSELGVWELLSQHASPILGVHVSEEKKLGRTFFSSQELKVPALGFVVPFFYLQQALYQAVSRIKKISFQSIENISEVSVEKNSIRLSAKTICCMDDTPVLALENEPSMAQSRAFPGATRANTGDIIHAADSFELIFDFLIAADGSNSQLRKQLRIDVEEKNSDDIAAIFRLTLNGDHQHIAYERFTQHGVFALLPLKNNQMQLVWTVSKKFFDTMQDEKKLLSLLKNIFEGRIDIADAKLITHFPLQYRVAKQQAGDAWVLLGNAAHTIYPVAAQGFNLSLHDIDVLSKNELRDYEKKVLPHQKKIYSITSTWIACFELPCVGFLRGLSLMAIDIIKPIKKKLANQLMGISNA